MNAESIRRILKGREGWAVGAAFLLILVFFWPTLITFPATWSQYAMSHGWLVTAIAAWLIWRERDRLLIGRGGDSLLLVPIVVLSLLWLGSTVAYIQLGHQLSLLLLLVFWALLVLGRNARELILVLGAAFFLALPIVWGRMTPILREVTTIASGTLVNLMGIRAEIEGDLIHIAVGTFIIEDGCAGFNYFYSATVIALAYALLLVRGWKKQLAIVALGAGIAIVGNWIRVAALIVIGHFTQMQSPLMDDHIWFGWVIFSIGLIPFFILARKIEKWGKGRRAHEGVSGLEGAPPRGDDLADDEPAITASEPEPQLSPPFLRRTVLATSFAVVGPVVYVLFSLLPPTTTDPPALAEFQHGDGWTAVQGPDADLPAWRPAYQGAQEEERVLFTDGTAQVQGHRLVYREQAQGAKLIGYPNRIADREDVVNERVVGPVDRASRRWVRQAIVRTEEGAVITWYWYRVGGIETFSRVQAKVLEIPAFFRRDRTAELLSLSAECSPEECTEAFQHLRSVTGLLDQRVDGQGPEPTRSEFEPGSEPPRD